MTTRCKITRLLLSIETLFRIWLRQQLLSWIVIVNIIEHLHLLGMSNDSVLKFNLQLDTDTVTVSAEDKLKLDKGGYEKLWEFLYIDWEDILVNSTNDVDTMWERLKNILLEGINEFIPRGRQNVVSDAIQIYTETNADSVKC